MRPSATQLLQPKRTEFIFNVAETEKMYVDTIYLYLIFFKYGNRLSVVKGHRSTLANKEREILSREQAIAEKENTWRHSSTRKTRKSLRSTNLRANYNNHISCHSMNWKCLSSRLSLVERRSLDSRVLNCKREEELIWTHHIIVAEPPLLAPSHRRHKHFFTLEKAGCTRTSHLQASANITLCGRM